MSIKLLGKSAVDNSTVTLLEPSSMTITRAYDTPAIMLEITFPTRELIPDLTNIQVNHGSEVLFFGYCDEIIRSIDDSGSFVTINARSPGSLLCDNEATPMTYTNLTAAGFFTAQLQPLGFSTLTVPNTTASTASFQVNKGFSVWEAFTQLCFRLYGREPYIKPDMSIVVEALPETANILISNDAAENALRYCSLEYITRRSSAISRIIYRDTDGDYSQLLANPFGNPLSVARTRYVIPAAEYSTVPSLDAYQRILHGERGVYSARITLPKLHNFYPGTILAFRDPLSGLRVMAVYQVKIIYNKTGCRTRVVLAKPVYM